MNVPQQHRGRTVETHERFTQCGGRLTIYQDNICKQGLLQTAPRASSVCPFSISYVRSVLHLVTFQPFSLLETADWALPWEFNFPSVYYQCVGELPVCWREIPYPHLKCTALSHPYWVLKSVLLTNTLLFCFWIYFCPPLEIIFDLPFGFPINNIISLCPPTVPAPPFPLHTCLVVCTKKKSNGFSFLILQCLFPL